MAWVRGRSFRCGTSAGSRWANSTGAAGEAGLDCEPSASTPGLPSTAGRTAATRISGETSSGFSLAAISSVRAAATCSHDASIKTASTAGVVSASSAGLGSPGARQTSSPVAYDRRRPPRSRPLVRSAGERWPIPAPAKAISTAWLGFTPAGTRTRTMIASPSPGSDRRKPASTWSTGESSSGPALACLGSFSGPLPKGWRDDNCNGRGGGGNGRNRRRSPGPLAARATHHHGRRRRVGCRGLLALGGERRPHHAICEAVVGRVLGERLHLVADGPQFVQQLPVGGVGGEVGFDRGPLGGGKLIVQIGAEQFVRKFASHAKSILFRLIPFTFLCQQLDQLFFELQPRARCRRLRTVPTGRSKISAIVS